MKLIPLFEGGDLIAAMARSAKEHTLFIHLPAVKAKSTMNDIKKRLKDDSIELGRYGDAGYYDKDGYSVKYFCLTSAADKKKVMAYELPGVTAEGDPIGKGDKCPKCKTEKIEVKNYQLVCPVCGDKWTNQ